MRTLKTVLIASALQAQFGFVYVLGCSCNAVGEGLPRRYLARLSPHTRAGRVPASYPTTSTRRLMNPTADARTGRKAYADCRRDCRNTGINIQRDQQEVNARALLPAFLCSVPRLGWPLSPFAGSGYILGAIACAYACRSPPRTKPRYASLVPKGSLSLTQMYFVECN